MSDGPEIHTHCSGEVEALTSQLEAVAILDDTEQDTILVRAEGDDNGPVCCICHDACVNPVRLPCQHVFCYLCIKGVAVRSKRCALCRQHIPLDSIEKPIVVNKDAIKAKLEKDEDNYHWFYEAKNGGWWMYEERASSEIEKAYGEDKQTIRLQVSGFTYVVDFGKMVQYREHFPNRRRKIKRDVIRTNSVKGVAGIYVGDGQTQDGQGSRDERTPPDDSGPSDPSQPVTSSSGHDSQSRLVTGLD